MLSCLYMLVVTCLEFAACFIWVYEYVLQRTIQVLLCVYVHPIVHIYCTHTHNSQTSVRLCHPGSPKQSSCKRMVNTQKTVSLGEAASGKLFILLLRAQAESKWLSVSTVSPYGNTAALTRVSSFHRNPALAVTKMTWTRVKAPRDVKYNHREEQNMFLNSEWRFLHGHVSIC
jgi:hypothetical protein